MINFATQNDYELLYLVKRGSEEAINILIDKYRLYAYKKVYKYYLNKTLMDDIVQECLCVLVKAFTTFQTEFDVLFISYIDVIFTRRINRLLRTYFSNSNVDKYFVNEAQRKGAEKLTKETPLENVIHDAYLKNIKELLTTFENLILDEVMLDCNKIHVFAKKYNVSPKKVYNSIQSIRQKTQMLVMSFESN